MVECAAANAVGETAAGKTCVYRIVPAGDWIRKKDKTGLPSGQNEKCHKYGGKGKIRLLNVFLIFVNFLLLFVSKI